MQHLERLPVEEPSRALRRSLRAADRDAALASVMNGTTDPFMPAYALALGASHFEVGLLSSVRNLLLALVQLGSAEAVRRLQSRRTVVIWTVAIQTALWLPLAAVQPLFGSAAVPAMIVLYTIGTATAALGGPAWGSLIADYVQPHERGRYFGRRARLSGIATSASTAAAGGILQIAQGGGTLGFSILCTLAALSRYGSWRSLRRFHDEGWKEEPHLRFSFRQFLRQTPRSNFARFSLCIGASNFSAHVAAPYFAVYLLDELRYSYATYTAVILSTSLVGIFSSTFWGHSSDRIGNHAILQTGLLTVVPLPLLWLVSGDPIWMTSVNALGAFLWGGINLSAANFVYDAVSPGKRHTCIAYFNVVNGVGVSLGAFAGGWLARSLSAEDAHTSFVVLFATSALLRLAAALAFRRWVREVREVRQSGLREVILDMVGVRLVAVLGLLSVRPEEEQGPAPASAPRLAPRALDVAGSPAGRRGALNPSPPTSAAAAPGTGARSGPAPRSRSDPAAA
jgi:MFS family permease